MDSMNNLEIRTLAGKIIQDESDWQRVDAMTDEEATQAAFDDPDAQPVTGWNSAKRLRDLSGNTLIEKLGSLKKGNKHLLSVRYDPDIIEFFKSKGKDYQSLMNNVLREYMDKELRKQS